MTGHIIIFLIVAIVLLLIGVPVAATLGLSSILFFVLEGIPAMTVVQRLFSGCDVAALMCIPFFILAGDLMAKGGIAKRLVNVCNMAIGNVTGGLALVTIVVCAIFAAMTGSAMACCVTIGAIMLPYMLEACLLYTSDAADEEDSVDLGGRPVIKKKTRLEKSNTPITRHNPMQMRT